MSFYTEPTRGPNTGSAGPDGTDVALYAFAAVLAIAILYIKTPAGEARLNAVAPDAAPDALTISVSHADTAYARTYCQVRGLAWTRLESSEGGRRLTVWCEGDIAGGDLPPDGVGSDSATAAHAAIDAAYVDMTKRRKRSRNRPAETRSAETRSIEGSMP